MTSDDFDEFLDRHGVDPARWPADLAVDAEAMLQRDPAARVALAKAAHLGQLLEFGTPAAPFDAARVAASVKTVGQETPRPAIRVDGFRPARARAWAGWRPTAALAASLVAGLLVGQSGWLQSESAGGEDEIASLAAAIDGEDWQ
jgi:hypothetical protein